MTEAKRFVVVTTDKDKRGVFGGYLESYDPETHIAILSDAHMAVYWSQATKGVLGLASIGPQNGSKISPPVPTIEINGVTAVMDCTKEAMIQWQKAIWS